MTTERLRFTIVFSCTDFPYQTVLKHIAPTLGAKFAGACCEPVNGVWSPDGDEFKTTYSNGMVEDGMRVTLTVLPDAEGEVMPTMQNLLSDLKEALKLNINWVHVEKESIQALHFKLP